MLARLSKLKGVPKLSYKDKLLKKSLKNKLLKKAKKERRRQKMPKNIKSENGDVAPKKQKPVLNSEGQVIYSKFDFSVLGAKKTDLKKPKVDPKIMLQKLKEQEKMVKNLKEEGKIDEAKQIVERKAIKTALMKMEGVKVKDDTELLKKSIKKKKMKKIKSVKKWQDRENKVRKDKEERQMKRTKNIQARAHQKKLGKLKKAAKKGRIIPGF